MARRPLPISAPIALLLAAMLAGCGDPASNPDGDLPVDGDLDEAEAGDDSDLSDQTDQTDQTDLPDTPDGDPEETPIDCTGCEAFPGRYCLASMTDDNCPEGLAGFLGRPDSEFIIQASDRAACTFSLRLRLATPDGPVEASDLVDGCGETLIELIGEGGIDPMPPIPFAWDPRFGTVAFGWDFCRATYWNQACRPAADGDVDQETDLDPALHCDLHMQNPACPLDGVPARTYQAASADPGLNAPAGEVELATLDGPWRLSEQWTGCDVYLFVQESPRQTWGFPTPLWQRDHAVLLDRLPANAHIFFLSFSEDPAAIETALENLRTRIEFALATRPQVDQERLRAHIHYVTEPGKRIAGWLGQNMTAPGWGAGIDRFQRVRWIGSYADPARYYPAKQWFEPNLSMVANEAIHYNYEARREAARCAVEAVEIPVFPGELVQGSAFAEATLPDAAAMQRYDTLEWDVSMGCQGSGEYGDCPAWDRIVNLFLCDSAAPDSCETELGRWITTYHREGRWTHDASGLLPLLDAGGRFRFRFYSQDPYEVRLNVRLSNRGKQFRPRLAVPLFTANGNTGFGPDYNDHFVPLIVERPATARRIDLATVITGHGMSMPGNCAEFCDTTHIFTVNDRAYTFGFPETADHLGCMRQVADGTVPNQYGTWWYGRSGWCPGKHVPLVMTDVTPAFSEGTSLITYQGFYLGAPYDGDNWRFIEMRSWLVFSW